MLPMVEQKWKPSVRVAQLVMVNTSAVFWFLHLPYLILHYEIRRLGAVFMGVCVSVCVSVCMCVGCTPISLKCRPVLVTVSP